MCISVPHCTASPLQLCGREQNYAAKHKGMKKQRNCHISIIFKITPSGTAWGVYAEILQKIRMWH